ncbi:MAG: hypothetical protein PSX80_01915 [bacterium]|nr:hypothetical protein [bacterium]
MGTLAAAAFPQSASSKNSDCCFDLKFKFIIASNWADQDTREVFVFMDPAAFNDRNLRKLFDYFATKYKSPDTMSVTVETSWYRVAVPNIDCEPDVISGMPDDPEREKYHWALYMKRGDNEVYRFNPRLGDRSMETVLLKGKPF